MSKIINFPQKKIRKANFSEDKKSVENFIDTQAFFDLIQEWPCFMEKNPSLKSLEQIFDIYYEDNLSESQSLALEFLFHMHDPSIHFDIGKAFYVWDEDDRNFFFMSLNLHMEIILEIRKSNETKVNHS